jgi:hypothetical protein
MTDPSASSTTEETRMWDWIKAIDNPDQLQELIEEAQEALANPFISRWGSEHNGYLLHDAKARLAQLL